MTRAKTARIGIGAMEAVEMRRKSAVVLESDIEGGNQDSPSRRPSINDNLPLGALLRVAYHLLITPHTLFIQFHNGVLCHIRLNIGNKVALNLGPLGVEQLGEDGSMGRLLGLFQRVWVDGCGKGCVDRVSFSDPTSESTIKNGNLVMSESLSLPPLHHRSALFLFPTLVRKRYKATKVAP